MEKEVLLLLTIFSFFLLKPIAFANDDCSPASCSPQGPEVRFPFRILGRQPDHCGYPGFDLSCDEQNQTILQLPSSHSYIVNSIYYVSQVIYIDPGFCRPNGLADVNITDTPFSYIIFNSYTFYNCSLQSFDYIYQGVPFPCLSSGNYSVIASDTGFMPSNCKVMKTIKVLNRNINEELKLMWFTPYCRSCEREGKPCGLKSDGQTSCVTSSRGISRSIKYLLSIGIGVPTLIFIIGLACYASSKAQGPTDTRNHGIDLTLLARIPQPAPRTGLDGATIDSYPKTVLGDSCILPNDDDTCSICLSDYKPKESLRTIPQCNHYFHAECIDEWLKLNATCPVCRIKPESSALVTPCFSASSSTSADSF